MDLPFLLLIFLNLLHLSTQLTPHPNEPFKLNSNTTTTTFSFPLRAISLPHNPSSFLSSLFSFPHRKPITNPIPSYNFKSSFKYSVALIVSLPIGTPPQTQPMVLDTGSQLSWIQCHEKAAPPPPRKTPPATAFDPSLSSSFSVLPCTHPACKPRIPDFTIPTTCDQNRLCHYSYFYADGTFAEGNLVREKLALSTSQTTPPIILGCATASAEAQGILGMNRGRLSFASQARVSRFSYCVPRRSTANNNPTGSFHLGPNPNSHGFK